MNKTYQKFNNGSRKNSRVYYCKCFGREDGSIKIIKANTWWKVEGCIWSL
jgi:hypothetical protein